MCIPSRPSLARHRLCLQFRAGTSTGHTVIRHLTRNHSMVISNDIPQSAHYRLPGPRPTHNHSTRTVDMDHNRNIRIPDMHRWVLRTHIPIRLRAREEWQALGLEGEELPGKGARRCHHYPCRSRRLRWRANKHIFCTSSSCSRLGVCIRAWMGYLSVEENWGLLLLCTHAAIHSRQNFHRGLPRVISARLAQQQRHHPHRRPVSRHRHQPPAQHRHFRSGQLHLPLVGGLSRPRAAQCIQARGIAQSAREPGPAQRLSREWQSPCAMGRHRQ